MTHSVCLISSNEEFFSTVTSCMFDCMLKLLLVSSTPTAGGPRLNWICRSDCRIKSPNNKHSYIMLIKRIRGLAVNVWTLRFDTVWINLINVAGWPAAWTGSFLPFASPFPPSVTRSPSEVWRDSKWLTVRSERTGTFLVASRHFSH